MEPVLDQMLSTNDPECWKQCWDQFIVMPTQELTPPGSPILGAQPAPITFDLSALTGLEEPLSPKLESFDLAIDELYQAQSFDDLCLKSDPSYTFIHESVTTNIKKPKESQPNTAVPPLPKTAFKMINDLDKGQMFECTVPNCGKRFTRRAENAKAHWLLHQNLVPYNCGRCGAGFHRKHELKRHTKSFH